MNKNSPAGMSVHSGSTDWNTPKKYVDLLHDFYDISLDPCSNSGSIVCAKTEIVLPNDGLSIEWDYATIFINPPYGRDLTRKTTIKDWVRKAYESHNKYDCEIIMLIPVATNTTHWREYIFNGAKCICFLYDTRLKFRINGNEDNKGCPMACCLVYYGQREDKFRQVFKHVGHVMSV